LLEEGQDNSSIVSFMVDRFGEFVHYKPQVKPATYLLWYGPWAILILGVVMIIFIASHRATKKNKTLSDTLEPGDVDSTEQRDKGKSSLSDQHEQVEQLLSRFKDD
jgi:cytochrome c-type biogenesis protein CcmH